MKKLKFDKKKTGIKDLLFGKGYYVALAICLLAVGIAGFTAFQRISNPPVDNPANQTAASTEKQAGVNVQGIPNNQTTTPETTVPAQTEPTTNAESMTTTNPATTSKIDQVDTHTPFESYYMFPLGDGVLKEYSKGELVYSETMNDWRVHNGIDFRAKKGDGVKAINDGVVSKIYEDPMLGVVIEINHGGGMVAKYCGLAKNPPVKVNAEVDIGQIIGMVGEVPMEGAEESHLHLEIYVDKKLVDPLAAMGKGEDRN